jgi:hypothetical protein
MEAVKNKTRNIHLFCMIVGVWVMLQDRKKGDRVYTSLVIPSVLEKISCGGVKVHRFAGPTAKSQTPGTQR